MRAAKYLISAALTLIVTTLLYEELVRRTGIRCFLFGMKLKKKQVEELTTLAEPAAW